MEMGYELWKEEFGCELQNITVKQVDDWLKRGKDINSTLESEDKRTLLHEMVGVGNVPVARFLIENKANVEARDKWGKTPLHDAGPHMDMVRLLVEEGKADVNAKDFYDWTPLHYAVSEYNGKQASVYLAENGSDPRAVGKVRTPQFYPEEKRTLMPIELTEKSGVQMSELDAAYSKYQQAHTASAQVHNVPFFRNHWSERSDSKPKRSLKDILWPFSRWGREAAQHSAEKNKNISLIPVKRDGR